MKLTTIAGLVALTTAGCAPTSVRSARLTTGMHKGQLGPAKYCIAVPKEWNGNVLILAHGYRDETVPLSADFDPNAPYYRGLLDSGWVVASTSYRRNGMIVQDAAADIEALRSYLVHRMGGCERVFVQGSSMGGAVIVVLAETYPGRYDGFLAIGAALSCHDKDKPYLYTYKPTAPILFLANQSELRSPRAYARAAEQSAYPPAVWTVSRDGHCNVNRAETVEALRGLTRWVRTGRIQHSRNVTISPAGLASVAAFRDGVAFAKITHVGTSYGNLDTAFIQNDLDRLGIKPTTHFMVGMGDKRFRVFLGKTYGDVPRGDWVAFLTAEGRLRIARNYANAAETLGCVVGDEVFIGPVDSK